MSWEDGRERMIWEGEARDDGQVAVSTQGLLRGNAWMEGWRIEADIVRERKRVRDGQRERDAEGVRSEGEG